MKGKHTFITALLVGTICLLLSSQSIAMTLSDARTTELEQLTLTKTIPELVELMKKGKLSSAELVQFYLNRIEQLDSQYNSIITVNPDAKKLAKIADKQLKSGHKIGLLHGLPIVVKDNIETDNMPTTAGSLALKDNHTYRDAPLIANLKRQGAIILAKTNLSEWANFRSTRSSSGWSAVGGQTKNPHDVTRSTCGSSSGSGAAIAANLAVAAVGTETDGSITCPSSATGIVGIKPTVGLVSRTGVVPISSSQDTAGPMAKSVTDAAYVLAALQGKDKSDNATSHYPFNFTDDYNSALTSKELSTLKLGIINSPAINHEQVNELFSQLLSLLEQKGTNLNRDVEFEPYNELYNDEFSVLMYEFKHDLNNYFASLPNELKSLTLEKLIAFNKENAEQEMNYFKQEVFDMSQEKGSLDSKEYQEQLKSLRAATRGEGIDKLLNEHQLDALISVTLGPTWKIDKVNGDHYTGGISSYSAISGYPHITIPLGKVHGLPIGLSIMGTAQTERKLIQIAYSLEQLLK